MTEIERLELEGQLNLFVDYLREKIARAETERQKEREKEC